MVEAGSSILQIPGERIITLHADHRSMCRFEGKKDESCSVALKAIERVAVSVLLKRKLAVTANRTSSIECTLQ